jgi:lysophospholipase L1-like esterase
MLCAAMPSTSIRTALAGFCLFLAVAGALLAWLYDPFRGALGPVRISIAWGWKPAAAVAVALALRIAAGRGTRPGLFDRPALGVGMVLLLLLAIEGALAAAGVSRGTAFAVQQKDGAPVRADGAMVHDPHLLWRFQPGATFNGRVVNELGFLGRAATALPEPGTRRVICMGDSCTAQGLPPYSDLLHDALADRPPGGHRWESFNTGVHGYSVLQGLALFRKRLAALQPDVVTLYFGWNGHWLADEHDHVTLARHSSPMLTALKAGIARKRLATALRSKREAPTAKRVLRVPPERYSAALTELVAEIRAVGALPVILTAPRADRISGRLVHQGHAASVDEAHRLHDDYAERTRDVAGRAGVPLLDLAREFDAADRNDLFSDDGIHLTDTGRQLVADRLHAVLTRHAAAP